ncbi:MAG: ATP-binding protein [Ignavibacteria bacterium]|nr:ATP-binding protein [Ignavibacteria bacterium]
MYLLELYKLIEDGEGKNIEFKRKFSTPEKIAKELIAFANSDGGYMIFGVDDDRSVVGINSEKEELELINTAARHYCLPAVNYTYEIICIKNKDVVVVKIEKSKSKPHKLINSNDESENRVYIRFNDKSVIASKETVNLLKHSNENAHSVKFSFGNAEKILLKYLSENEKITVKKFKKLANISERRAGRTLVNLVRIGVLRHHRIDDNEFFVIP